MKIKFDGKEVATITTNRSLTIEEALFAHGYDINSPEDCEKAYNDGFPAAYVDDYGNYQIDTAGLIIEY